MTRRRRPLSVMHLTTVDMSLALLVGPQLDAVVAHGTPEAVAARLNEHLDAGADTVTIQVLGGWDKLLPTLAELAGPLGLKG